MLINPPVSLSNAINKDYMAVIYDIYLILGSLYLLLKSTDKLSIVQQLNLNT